MLVALRQVPKCRLQLFVKSLFACLLKLTHLSCADTSVNPFLPKMRRTTP